MNTGNDGNDTAQLTWESYYQVTMSKPPSPLLVKALAAIEHKEYALDLGCGAGKDTRFLLTQGFHVTAVDMNELAIEHLKSLPQENLRVVRCFFDQFEFAHYDLVNAQNALSFNPHATFIDVFTRMKSSLRPGGVFTGHLFGNRDAWNTPDTTMSFFTRREIEDLLYDLSIIELKERDEDGPTELGPAKHWHLFEIIAKNSRGI